MFILASDYDNTLHFKDGISKVDIEMIHKLRENGGKFGLVSGRAISSLINETKKHNIPFDFLIGVNGGFIVDHKLNQIHSTYISNESAKEIISYLNENQPLSYTLHDGYRLHRKVFKENFPLDIVAEFVDKNTLLNDKVSGFFTHFKSEEDAKIHTERINQQYKDILAQQNTSFIDISAPNINKAHGIQIMLDHFEWDLPIWVIGDAENDQMMIENYNSFALSHANEKLRNSATHVVDSLSEAILLKLQK